MRKQIERLFTFTDTTTTPTTPTTQIFTDAFGTFTDTTTAPTTPTTQIFTDPFGNKVNYTGQMTDGLAEGYGIGHFLESRHTKWTG
jgi:hypothetical protein